MNTLTMFVYLNKAIGLGWFFFSVRDFTFDINDIIIIIIIIGDWKLFSLDQNWKFMNMN